MSVILLRPKRRVNENENWKNNIKNLEHPLRIERCDKINAIPKKIVKLNCIKVFFYFFRFRNDQSLETNCMKLFGWIEWNENLLGNQTIDKGNRLISNRKMQLIHNFAILVLVECGKCCRFKSYAIWMVWNTNTNSICHRQSTNSHTLCTESVKLRCHFYIFSDSNIVGFSFLFLIYILSKLIVHSTTVHKHNNNNNNHNNNNYIKSHWWSVSTSHKWANIIPYHHVAYDILIDHVTHWTYKIYMSIYIHIEYMYMSCVGVKCAHLWYIAVEGVI